jgi:hypothetical protein
MDPALRRDDNGGKGVLSSIVIPGLARHDDEEAES